MRPIKHRADLYELKKVTKTIIGAIFCQVINIAAEIQLRLFITEGNQKCMGANPSFIDKPSIGNNDIVG